MKPIKANKYFYFRMHPLWPEASKVQANHRDIGAPQRGYYKITNPYELQSLDDIFGTAPAKTQSNPIQSNPFAPSAPKTSTNSFNEFDIDTSNLVKAKNEIPVENKTSSVDPFDFTVDKNVAPASSVVRANQIDDTAIIKGNGSSDIYDLQAELEKKFDELFGNTNTKTSNY
jgi:hypothetical protein